MNKDKSIKFQNGSEVHLGGDDKDPFKGQKPIKEFMTMGDFEPNKDVIYEDRTTEDVIFACVTCDKLWLHGDPHHKHKVLELVPQSTLIALQEKLKYTKTYMEMYRWQLSELQKQFNEKHSVLDSTQKKLEDMQGYIEEAGLASLNPERLRFALDQCYEILMKLKGTK